MKIESLPNEGPYYYPIGKMITINTNITISYPSRYRFRKIKGNETITISNEYVQSLGVTDKNNVEIYENDILFNSKENKHYSIEYRECSYFLNHNDSEYILLYSINTNEYEIVNDYRKE